ncbi:hypothetical protein QJQ45_019742, partial [Haematococcus lacustris]
ELQGAQHQLGLDQQQLLGAEQQLALDQQQLHGAKRQLTMDQGQLQGAQHQLALDQQQLKRALQQLTLDQQQLKGAQQQLALDQQQLALDQQQLKGAQQQLAQDQQHLKGAQQQQAQALEQLQGAQQQQAQALEQLQNSRTGLERSELLLRQHMDACMRAHTMDLPSLAAMQPEMRHICFMRNCVPRAAAQAAYSPALPPVRLHNRCNVVMFVSWNVQLLKEYARECLGWKGKRLTQKKPLLRADILEHLRWEQEMEEDQLAEVGVDEADEM